MATVSVTVSLFAFFCQASSQCETALVVPRHLYCMHGCHFSTGNPLMRGTGTPLQEGDSPSPSKAKGDCPPHEEDMRILLTLHHD